MKKSPRAPIPLPALGGPEYTGWASAFWSLVNKSWGPDACWPWLGRRDKKGYGRYHFGGRDSCLAHRLAFAIANGRVPAGAQVNHSCDNPSCVRPAHLHLGSHKSNMMEMAMRGRAGRLRFPAEVVDAMRQMRTAGARYREIADQYGTTAGVAQSVVTGRRRRRHLPSTVQPPPPIRLPIAARINLLLAALLDQSGCASTAAIAAGFGLDGCSLRYALDRASGGLAGAGHLAGAAQIAILIAEIDPPVPPLGASMPGQFLPSLPLDQETGLAAGHPLGSLMGLYRRLSPRLTRADVAELRGRHRDGESLASLSRRFKIHPGHASRVARGHQWSDAPGYVLQRANLRGRQKAGARLSEADVVAIRQDYAGGGVSQRALARRYGVGATTIYSILHGRRWAHVGAA